MRQAIKGDGSDGTAALKAYLLAHDNVMSQELYEFTKPLVGGGLVAPVPPEFEWEDPLHAFMRTTQGTFTPDPNPTWVTYSEATVSAAAGYMARWLSRPLGGANFPGTLSWQYAPAGSYGAPGSDSGSVPPRSRITRVIVAMTIYTIPGNTIVWEPFTYLEFSIDGGSTWTPMASGSGLAHSATEFSADITAAIVAAGGIASFDFTSVQLRVRDDSTVFIDDTAPGWQFFITNAGLRLVFDRPQVGGIPPGFCDASSALTYAGQVYAPANIKNDGFKSKIGLDVDSLQLEWTFRGDEAMVTDPNTGATILTMLQGFQQGLWDGVWVKWWRVYMPSFGDCDSLGAVRMFRGRIADVQVDRLKAKITVNSVTEMFNRQVPQQLIEANNRSLQVGPGLPPDLNPDPSHWTFFECVAGHDGTVQKIVAQQTAPTADQVYAPGTFDLGYLWFQASPLEFFVAQVQRYEVIAGYNVFYLFRPLYVDPHGYGLSFAAFVPVPKDQTLSGAPGVELHGFRYVPLPEQAV